MNLLDEIRSDLVNESASLSNTLRKAKILASAIGLPEFREWVEFELNGYKDRESVPEYRQVRPTNLGTLSGPFQSMAKNVVLPTYVLPDIVRDFAECMVFFDGVGELEALAGGSALHKRWPQEMLVIAQEVMEWSGGMVLIDAQQPILSHVILGILDQVKNKLLDFVLGLQESNITSEDLEGRNVTSEIARNIFNVTIHGDRNTVASGENINQIIRTVQKGETDSLLNFLRELNIDDEDIHEIETAVSAEPNAISGRLGPKVRTWLGGMMEKTAAGVWGAGLNTAVEMLTHALYEYYGINQQR